MKKPAAILPVILLALPLCFAAPVIQAEETVENPGEILPMSRSMEKLIQLIEQEHSLARQSAELQKLEIAVSYLSFRHRRIEAKEEKLQNLKTARQRVEDIVAEIEADPEKWNRFAQLPAPNKPVSTSFEEQPDNARLRLFKMRLEQMESEITSIETDIALLHGEMEDLEAYVQRGLELVR